MKMVSSNCSRLDIPDTEAHLASLDKVSLQDTTPALIVSDPIYSDSETNPGLAL
jgi:hypothetical protein